MRGLSTFQEYRGAASVVYYPQPIGFQAEWNFGRGPEYSVPTTDGSGVARANLIRAQQLLNDAGWVMKNGVRVNAVAPGYFATEANATMAQDPQVADWLARRTSLGRWGRVEEIAGAVTFLASPAASYVTGHTLAVDGGYLAHF